MTSVIYVTPVPIPHGGAAARRILGVAKSLQLGGFDVRIGSGGMGETTEPMDVEGIPTSLLSERSADHLPRALRQFAYLSIGRRTVEWLDSIQPRPALVILYGGYSPYLLRLGAWCRRNGVALAFDAVEWYRAPLLQMLAMPYYWNTEWAMRRLSPRTGNIIAISSWLADYYRSKGCKVVEVPPTLDTETLAPGPGGDGERLVLSYAGTPGRKDLFDEQVEAVLSVDPEGERLVLRVAGVDEARILASPALKRRGMTALPKAIETLGVVGGDAARAAVGASDFSLLLREVNRVSVAGFPTKVVESLALGTPVIGTTTGDLPRHLRDGETALVCSDCSAETLTAALRRGLAMSPDERLAMRKAARGEAVRSFDIRAHAAPLRKFIEEVA
jgi:glycosyltransferase involved in cell wall biosynthesis